MGKKVKYSYSLITYLDVLGFRDIISRQTPGQISRLVRILKETTKPDEEISRLHGMKFFNFSDTAIRITPLYTDLNLKNSFGYLYWEVLSLVHIQCDLIARGIIIRGALASGDIVKSWGVVYGPGLVKAYELEHLASFPRIIIDSNLLQELKINPALRAHSYRQELSYLKALIRQDADKHWFIDYLRAIETEMDFPEDDYPRFLRRHADLVAEGLIKYRLKRKVIQKFKWLQKYHNDTVQNSYGNRHDLMI